MCYLSRKFNLAVVVTPGVRLRDLLVIDCKIINKKSVSDPEHLV